MGNGELRAPRVSALVIYLMNRWVGMEGRRGESNAYCVMVNVGVEFPVIIVAKGVNICESCSRANSSTTDVQFRQ